MRAGRSVVTRALNPLSSSGAGAAFVNRDIGLCDRRCRRGRHRRDSADLGLPSAMRPMRTGSAVAFIIGRRVQAPETPLRRGSSSAAKTCELTNDYAHTHTLYSAESSAGVKLLHATHASYVVSPAGPVGETGPHRRGPSKQGYRMVPQEHLRTLPLFTGRD